MMRENISVLIVDDEPDALMNSKRKIENVFGHDIVCVEDASSVVKLLSEKTIDLAFLDIEMPSSDGFSIVEYIHKKYPDIEVVFLTGHVDMGAKSYEYEPLDFLVKPVDVIRLEKTLDKWERRKGKNKSDKIAVKLEQGFSLIDPDDILYIAKEKRQVRIHCKGMKAYSVRYSMDSLEAMFAEYRFLRTHQSFLVPMDKIQGVEPTAFGKTYEVVLTDGIKVPVSREKYSKLKDSFVNYGIRFL
jgi:DNA-binding LytR/AlgR family response regulator